MITPNPFVYEQTYISDIRCPTITATLQEHYSQCGEDIIITSLLRALISTGQISSLSKCICVEIGANHSFAGNNTYLLKKLFNLKSLLIEANPELIGDLQKSRPDDTIINVAVIDDDSETVDLNISNHHELSSINLEFVMNWHDGDVGLARKCKVPATRINQLLNKELPSDSTLLYLSIDVEGLDLRLIRDLDLSLYRPLIIQMEPSDHFEQGESDRMISYMTSREYRLFAKTPVNLIFIDSTLLNIENHSHKVAEALTQKARELSIENDKLTLETKEISAENSRLIAENESYRNTINNIESSRSMKIIKHLSKFKKIFIS